MVAILDLWPKLYSCLNWGVVRKSKANCMCSNGYIKANSTPACLDLMRALSDIKVNIPNPA